LLASKTQSNLRFFVPQSSMNFDGFQTNHALQGMVKRKKLFDFLEENG